VTIQPGSKLGTYEIVEKIGAGGMGAVYKGYQSALGRYVAIKILPPQTAGDPAFADRFAQEARAIGKLRHPNIVTAFDFAHEGDIAYLVSDYIDGGTLADQLGSPLPLDYTIQLLTPIAAALDYAHARGIVHRDIKPQNILMTHDGMPVLTDFGLAKIVGPGSGMTQAGSLMGTAEYMAPELTGGAETAGPAADQYALGLIAYQMLVGQHPFPADNPLSALMAHAHKPVPIPSTLGVTLTPGVEAALLRALAKRPQERFARSGDFVRALAGSAYITPSSAPPSAPISQPLRPSDPPSAPQAASAPSEPQASPLLSPSALVRPIEKSPSTPPAPPILSATDMAPPTVELVAVDAARAPTEPTTKTAPWWRTRRILVVPGALFLILVFLVQLGERQRAGQGASQAPASQPAAANDDHGNTPGNATVVTLPATQAGTILPGADVDVFKFVLRANQDITVELRLGTLGDGGVNILSGGGDQLAAENAIGTARTVTLNYKVRDAGTYGVAVHGVRGTTGTYQVVISAK
jgi:serine/threonine protein kinase